MKVGASFFGGVEMTDAGAGLPNPMDRRFSNAACWDATLKYIDAAVAADEMGYDSFWTTEHHFQYEGFEVIPNGILVSTWIAARTKQIKLGAMCNVVTQWNPLRLAEDFATMHNLSGGRGILGVGRGTVPREILHLNSAEISIGSHDNPDRVAADERNREWFEEAMEIVRLALMNETFSFSGKHFTLPVPGIPDRGKTVEQLTLVPRPAYPFEVWQTISSSSSVDYAAGVDNGAVFWLQNPKLVKRAWDRYADVYTAASGQELGRGDKRMLVLQIRIEDTHEAAVASARDGHDEFWKFLGPYGWSRNYLAADGRPAQPGLIPTLEESMAQRTILVGTAEEVASQVSEYVDALGMNYVTVFPMLPGDTYAKAVEQLGRFKNEVLPLVT
ncbi:MAG: LLM class flavin-dependent oxidoreductase [Acidimicrobiia bacterium]